MKHNKGLFLRFTSIFMVLILIFPMLFSTTIVLADEYVPDSAIVFSDGFVLDAETTMQDAVNYLLLDYAGMSELAFRSGNNGNIDRVSLARSIGMLDGVNFVANAVCSPEDFALMREQTRDLYEAMRKVPMEPFFVNGMAQPIFPLGGNTAGVNAWDTTGEGIARFIVWVETDYDTDNDGRLDRIKVLVQLPRAAVTQGMQVGTIFHAQPYNEGTNGQGDGYGAAVRGPGTAMVNEHGRLPHSALRIVRPPTIPTGEKTTAEMVAAAQVDCGRRSMSHADRCDCPWKSWHYTYQSVVNPNQWANVIWGVPNGNQKSGRNMLQYYLVRGFAAVSSAGIGTLEGDGIATYGTDVEIAAYTKVVEWLTGDARAFATKYCSIEVRADWSNGRVGMTGTSYGGSTPLGVASSGVEGLKAIVPVCGVVSYYEYTNQQGAVNWPGNMYVPNLIRFILNSSGRENWQPAWLEANGGVAPNFVGANPVRDRQMHYIHSTFLDANDLNGTYGDFWRIRDYTYDGWYRDWGPSRMRANMLIVHGLNDYNVRTKHSALMYDAAQRGGAEARLLWFQGGHTTPNNHMIGDFVYQEWLNKWFSYHLFEVDNNVLDLLPRVFAQSNVTGEFETHDVWRTEHKFIFDDSNRIRPGTDAPIISFDGVSPFAVEETCDIDWYKLGGYDPDLDLSELDYIPRLHRTEPAEDDEADIVMPTAAPVPGRIVPFDAANNPTNISGVIPTNTTLLNSALGTPNGGANPAFGSGWTTLLDGSNVGGSMVWSTVLTEDITIKGAAYINFRAAMETLGPNFDTNPNLQARVVARLVEVAAPGTTLSAFGSIGGFGSSPGTSVVTPGGVFQGGGLGPANIVRYNQTHNLAFREIARGNMSLAHPGAGWESHTAGPDSVINLRESIGVFHDYTLYTLPTVHTARAGNTLVLIFTIGANADSLQTGQITGNNAFSFSVCDDFTNVVIPIASNCICETCIICDGCVEAVCCESITCDCVPCTHDAFERAIALIEKHEVVFEVSEDIVTIEEIERELEKQLIEFFESHNNNFDPQVLQWRLADNGNGEFFLMDPDRARNANHQLRVIFIEGEFVSFAQAVARIEAADIPRLPRNYRETPAATISTLTEFVFGLLEESEEFAFNVSILQWETAVGGNGEFFLMDPSGANANHQIAVVYDVLLTYTLFAEDWRESINLRFFLDGEPVEIPLTNMELIVDGVLIDNIRDYTLNIADWQTAHHTVFICKVRHNWEHLTFSVTTHGQTLFFEFTNSMFVPPPELSFGIFNNGEGGSPSRPNASLNQAGLIRMWTQLDGVGAPLTYPNLSITATFPNGTSAMQFVRVNRAWVEGQGWQNHFSSIDILKGNGDWEVINFSITVLNQTVNLVLVNNRFMG
jgi:hypothetical protein